MTRFLVLLLAATSLTGCFHIRYTNDAPAAAEASQKNWHNDAVFGLVEISEPENVTKACPKGFGLVKSEEGFLAGLVNVVTLSLYNPTDVLIYCTEKK